MSLKASGGIPAGPSHLPPDWLVSCNASVEQVLQITGKIARAEGIGFLKKHCNSRVFETRAAFQMMAHSVRMPPHEKDMDCFTRSSGITRWTERICRS